MKRKSLVVLMMVMMLVIVSALAMASCTTSEPPAPPTPNPPAHTHTFGEWSMTKQPTATETGTIERTCTECKTKDTYTLPVNAGDNYAVTILVAPTCKEKGMAEYKLADIDFSFKAELPTIDHEYGEWTVKTAPTCTTEGIRHRVCNVCGEEVTENIPIIEHDYIDTFDGTHHWKECTMCHQKIEVKEHVFGEWTTIIEPTATEDGVEERYCECGYTERRAIHEYVDEVINPTCTKDGYTLHTCKRCAEDAEGHVVKDNIVPAYGHEWSEVTYEFAPDGSKCTARRHCLRENCTHDEVVNAVLIIGVVTLEPTCVKMGETTYNATFEEEWAEPQTLVVTDVPLAEHQYDLVNNGGKHWLECKVCHAQLDITTHTVVRKFDNIHHWDECTDCDYMSEKVEHDFEPWQVDKYPTCTEKGYRRRHCKDCGYAMEEVMPALGHDMSGDYVTDDTYHWKVCKRCGTHIEDKAEHTLSLQHNETHHWMECSVCHRHVGETAHTYGKWSITLEPTKTSTGTITRYCTECNEDEIFTLPALNDVDYKLIHQDPTCIAKGWDKYTYTKDGQSIDTIVEIDMIPHSYGTPTYTWNSDYTQCTAVRKCTTPNCNDTQTITSISVTSEIVRHPDCKYMGKHKYTATFDVEWNGNNKMYAEVVEDIPSTGEHYFEWKHTATEHWQECTGCHTEKNRGAHTTSDWIVDTEPTCTEKGKRHKECNECKRVLVEEEIQANGHSYGKWTMALEPTLKAVGRIERTCSVCGDVETFELPILNKQDYVYTSQTATCVVDGWEKYTCTKDTETFDIVINFVDHKTVPHTFGAVTIVWTEDGKSCTATRTCTVDKCGYSETITATMVDNGGTVITSEVTTPPTCSANGVTTYTVVFGAEYDWANEGTPLTKELADIPTVPHSFTKWYTEDGAQHWKVCEWCNTKDTSTIGAHEFTKWTIESEPTLKAVGSIKRECTTCGRIETFELPILNKQDYVYTSQTATCVVDGWEKYTYTKDTETFDIVINFVDHKTIPHTFGAVTIIWAEDGKSCTATRACTVDKCGYSESITATMVDNAGTVITSEVTTPPTCLVNGVETYTVVFGAEYDWANEGTPLTKELDMGKAPHSYTKWHTEDGNNHWKVCEWCNIKDESTVEAHTFTDWVVDVQPDCLNKGHKYRDCTICGRHEEQSIDALGHQLDAYNHDNTHHWLKCTRPNCPNHFEDTEHKEAHGNYEVRHDNKDHWQQCKCGYVTGIEKHTLNSDFECTYPGCGFKVFEYELIAGTETYRLTKSNSLENNIVIPATYKGKPVVEIGANAFADRVTNIPDLTIPDSIVKIGADAFAGMNNGVGYVHISSLEQWLKISFENYNSNPLNKKGSIKIAGNLLENIVIPETYNGTLEFAFAGMDGLSTVTLPKSMSSIGRGAFANSSLTSIIVPSNIKSIGRGAFANCKALTEVILEYGVDEILDNAFVGCDKNKTVVRAYSNVRLDGWYQDLESHVGLELGYHIHKYVQRYDDFEHWMECEICQREQEGSRASHNYAGTSDEETCTVCGYVHKIHIEGDFVYDVENTYEGVAIREYRGTDADIVIPHTLGGKNVTILAMPLGNNPVNSIHIPSTVKMITPDVFKKFVVMPDIIIDSFADWCQINYNGNQRSNPLSQGARLIMNGALVENVVIPSTVTKIADYAFCGYSYLKSLTIHSPVISIGDMAFDSCVRLETIEFGEDNVDIGLEAFRGCNALKKILLPRNIGANSGQGHELDSVANLINEKSTLLTRGELPANSIYTYFNHYLRDSVEGGIKYFIGDANKVVAYQDTTLEGDIVLPDGITDIVPYAFEDVANVTSLTIKATGIKVGKNAFKGMKCTLFVPAEEVEKYKNVVVNPDGLTVLPLEGEVFTDNNVLYAITTENTATAVRVQSTDANGYIHIPTNITYKGVTYNINDVHANVFADISQAIGISYPAVFDGKIIEKPKTVHPDILLDGVLVDGIYYQLGALDTCTVVRQPYALAGHVVVPSTINVAGKTYNVTAIATGAFAGCNDIDSIYIGEGVTTIGADSMTQCLGLKLVVLPASLTAIETGVLVGADSIASIYFKGNWTQFDAPVPGESFNRYNKRPAYANNVEVIIDAGIVYAKRGTDFYVARQIEDILGDVIIPEMVQGSSVVGVDVSAFEHYDRIISVTLPSSITAIEDRAFADMTNLGAVVIPNSGIAMGKDVLAGSDRAIVYCDGVLSGGLTVKPLTEAPNIQANVSTLDIDGVRYVLSGNLEGTVTGLVDKRSVVEIRGSIEHEGKTYIVKHVMDNVFADAYHVEAMTIPGSLVLPVPHKSQPSKFIGLVNAEVFTPNVAHVECIGGAVRAVVVYNENADIHISYESSYNVILPPTHGKGIVRLPNMPAKDKDGNYFVGWQNGVTVYHNFYAVQDASDITLTALYERPENFYNGCSVERSAVLAEGMLASKFADSNKFYAKFTPTTSGEYIMQEQSGTQQWEMVIYDQWGHRMTTNHLTEGIEYDIVFTAVESVNNFVWQKVK